MRPASDQQARAQSIKDLTAAQRMTSDQGTLDRIERVIKQRLDGLRFADVDWNGLASAPITRAVPRGVFVKPYLGANEPGILFVGFEYEWMRLLAHIDVEKFSSRYRLVLAPSSSPYNLANYVVPHTFGRPLFSLINHPEDEAIVQRISPNYRVIPLFTSHWTNPRRYTPRPAAERDIDIIMIAAWGKVKRHHRLMRALASMPSDLKVVLIGQDQEGRSLATIEDEARQYGVTGRFQALSNMPHAQVLEHLARSNVSLLLSRREGSAVVVPESLFSDTPTGLYCDAYNGSRSFINADTGRLLQHDDLAGQLTAFLADANAGRFKPRRWAMENISCFASSERMNAILKNTAIASGETWTRDIFTLCWQPDPMLVDPANDAATAADRAWMHEQFGLEIG